MGLMDKAGGILAAVTVGIIVVGAIQDRANKVEAARPTAEDARRIEAERLAKMTPAEREAEEIAKAAAEKERQKAEYGWRSETDTDAVSGKQFTTVTARSLSTFSLDFPYQGAQSAYLSARKHPRYGNDLFVSVRKGQLYCEHENCYISVRFDDGPVKRYSVSEPSDRSNNVWFINDTKRFSSDLAKSKRTFIELQFFQQGRMTVEFLTEGFKRP